MSVKGNTQILEAAGKDTVITAMGKACSPVISNFPLGVLFFFFEGIVGVMVFVAVFWLTYFICGLFRPLKPIKGRRRTRRRR